ncbi:MAG: putative signal-transduction protein with domain [Ilumatobacteraceae bacterium]|nr:putative signal-transduction protein with domain [Ilumatobacteraceae bacterium]
MKIIETMHRPPVSISPDATITQAAMEMERAGVGALGVVDRDELIGIVTDRDLVRRALATSTPSDARVDSVMTMPVVTIDASADLRDAYALFSANAVRRLAVVSGGRFLGIVATDDLLVHLAADLSDVVRPITAELLFSHHDTPLPAVVPAS